jgi:hypothetical protein
MEPASVVPTISVAPQNARSQFAARAEPLSQPDQESPAETSIAKVEPPVHQTEITPIIPESTKASKSGAPSQLADNPLFSGSQPRDRRAPQNRLAMHPGSEEQDMVAPPRRRASPTGETARASALPVNQSAVTHSSQEAAPDWKQPRIENSDRRQILHRPGLEPEHRHDSLADLTKGQSDLAAPLANSISHRNRQDDVPYERLVTSQKASPGSSRIYDGALQPAARLTAVPEINVTIGRIEIRAVNAPAPKDPPSKPRVSLDDYLQSRYRGAS